MRPWLIPMVILYTILCCQSGTASLFRIQGNNTLIALLPIYTADSQQCSDELNLKSAVQSQALVYAVEKLTSDPNFKDQISLGIDIEDICDQKPEELLNVMNTLLKRYKNNEATAFVTDLSDLLTNLVIHKSSNIPVFSLANQRQNNNAFILEPNKPRIGNAVARLVGEFNWTVYDVVVGNSDDYQHFQEATKSLKVCENRVFYEKFLSGQILNTGNETYPLVVFSDSLTTLSSLPSNLKERDTIIASNSLYLNERLPKTFALKQPDTNLDDFEEFLHTSVRNHNSWFSKLINNSAHFKECKDTVNKSCWSEMIEKLSGELRHGKKVIDVVYTVAHALKSTGKRSLEDNDIINTPEFTSPTGSQICFSKDKDLSKVQYNVYNLAKRPSALLGSIETLPDSTKAKLSLDNMDLNRDTTSCLATCPEGLSPVPTSNKCCVMCQKKNSTVCEKRMRLSKDGLKCVNVSVDYLKWKHPLSIVIFILVILLFCILFYLVNLYHKKGQNSVILTSKLATMPLLFSLFITLILPLLLIIKPSSTSCNAYVFGYVQALGIPICVLISRSNSYFKKFRTEDGSLKKKVFRSNPQNLIAVFLILFQIILSIIFVAVASAHVVYYETDDPYVDYIECSTFSTGEFLFPFFYTIVLSLFFTIKNFGAETNEEDTYESHFTAIFFFGFYFLSFVNIILVYGVIGKLKIMLLCVLGVLHLLNFLLFIFFPKVYVIVFKRDPIRFSPYPLNSDREVLVIDMRDHPIED